MLLKSADEFVVSVIFSFVNKCLDICIPFQCILFRILQLDLKKGIANLIYDSHKAGTEVRTSA